MNVEGFIAEFRRVMRDSADPQLWSDEEIVTYLNDAINEACGRALLLEDRTTPAVCSVVLVAGEGTYPLHESVLRIKRVSYRGCQLHETSVEELDATCHGWETRQGLPRSFIFEGDGSLRLVPQPSEAGTVALTVYRLPLEPLSADIDSAETEVGQRFHMRLMAWVYRCAYLKDDADTYDKAKADRQEAIFEASFGKWVDANVQRKQRDRRPPVVRMHW